MVVSKHPKKVLVSSFQCPMEQTGKEEPRQTISSYSTHSLFDGKTKGIFDGLNLASCNPNDFVEAEEAESESIHLETEKKLAISEAKFCNACQVHFSDRDEQLLHYKSDWHRYNLHLRLRGAQHVTEDQFETISGDVSSISGSDDEEDKDEAVKSVEDLTVPSDKELEDASLAKQRDSHKVFFKNNNGDLLSVHRCLLHHKKHPIYEKDELIAAASELPGKQTWAILMVTCGHFAGAIFNGKDVLEHKTFHRYTVRKKRGTAQSSHDNKGQHANSAGANLRRYNEAALLQEVQDLLSKWQEALKSCHFVFVRIPIANRGMFFAGKNAPFQKNDLRIRVIPFPTRRPTFSELKRVQQLLASVECFGREADFGTTMPRSPRKFYNKESGQLEIKHPVHDGKPQQSKNKSRPSSGKSTQNSQESVTEREQGVYENEEVDMDLVETVEEISFADLKEFEHSPKRKRNKAKEKGTVSKIVDLSSEEKEIRWKNSLFTASKTGNENVFKIIVDEMATHHKEEANRDKEEAKTAIPGSGPTLASDELLTSESQVSNQEHSNSSQGRPMQQSYFTEPISSEASTDSGPTVIDQTKCDSSAEQIKQFLNRPLGDGGQTLLHVASKENQAQLVLLLLEHGANPALKDKTGKTPYNLGGPDVRNTFRRFMSLWPDKYDYATAQIPSPLTEEMEAEKRRKVAEKRKAKKKAANERNKEKKAAEALVREEEKEKDRFLALSDREKRALAAERRILQQHSESSVKPVLSRCWQCASDITGKIPFEYSDYKFCSTKCLRDHRSKK